MSTTAAILLKSQWIEDEEFETGHFETLPREGETLDFAQGIDHTRSPDKRVDGTAYCRVVAVHHEVHVTDSMRVGYAYLIVEPFTDADLALLKRLYPDIS